MRVRILGMLAAVGAMALTGCSADEAASEPADVARTSVDIVDNVVVSACYTFDMPHLFEYSISPYSEACNTTIRMVGTDSLTDIQVLPQSGENSLDYFFAVMAGAADVEAETVTIAGIESGVVRTTNAWGLPAAVYFIPENQGSFEFEGEPITSFLITGPVGSSDLALILSSVVASFAVLD